MLEHQASIAQYYHERTKYDPETLQAKAVSIDWERQPVPFKEYKIGTSIALDPFLPSASGLVKDPEGRWWQRLSRLLYDSYGLTAKLLTATGDPVYLRAAPSAGGLYPAEVYLVSRGTEYLSPGLYSYQPKTHSLVRFWENQVWQDLQTACFWHPNLEHLHLALVVTAIFHRSAWRYQDRAYRRIFLDSGHLLGNIELAGVLTDYRPHLIGGFSDEAVNQLLYLDDRQEGAIAVLGLADLLDAKQNLPKMRTALASETLTEYPEIPDGELLGYFHRATQIQTEPKVLSWNFLEDAPQDKYNFPFCTKISTQTEAIDWSEQLSGLERTLLKRRSTRRYTGEDITLEELKALLDFTYQPQHYTMQEFDASPDFFDLNLLETFIAVSGVRGLEDGCYYYASHAQELRQIRFKNFRRELHFLCLGQELGRDAAAVLFHTADLTRAVEKYGDRVYRYLHMDAGHLGQRLNLAAIYIGLGVSGIGGFFDDRVNEVLGIPPDEAVVYITTLGRSR